MAFRFASRLTSLTAFLSLLCFATANNIVDLGFAKYRGNISNPNTVAYLGIPYAEPPTGDLRWRAPVPLNTARITRKARGAVLDAMSYPEFCVQGSTGSTSSSHVRSCVLLTIRRLWCSGGDAGGAGSEDCLKLNVYTPIKAKAGSKRE